MRGSAIAGVGNTITLGAGDGGNGSEIADLINDVNLCGGDCEVIDGYLTLTSGKQTSSRGNYVFGAGGSLQIFGEIPSLGLDSPVTLLDAQLAGGLFQPFFSGSPLFIGDIDPESVTLDPVLGSYSFLSLASYMTFFADVDPMCFTVGEYTGASFLPKVTLSTVPEPALPLLVIGVLGLAVLARRST
ncbi:MAG: hypothetical protein ABSE86_31640 [Bryobacteraceae bacterium]|jgi:hypothetical protein